MVLNELGSRITTALAAMSREMVIDEAVLDACLKEICAALLQVSWEGAPRAWVHCFSGSFVL
jgi:signal recognition particle GTPase